MIQCPHGIADFQGTRNEGMFYLDRTSGIAMSSASAGRRSSCTRAVSASRNPSDALYFLKRLAEFGKPPTALHGQNLRTDQGRPTFLARTSAGSGVIEQLTEGDGIWGS